MIQIDNQNDSINEVQDQDTSIEDKFKMAMKELSDHKLVPTQDNNFKSLSKEMNAFEASRKRTENLEKLYKALLNISPTSVASERAFSISGAFVTKRISAYVVFLTIYVFLRAFSSDVQLIHLFCNQFNTQNMIQSGFYIFIEIYRNLSFFFEKLAEFIVFFEKIFFDKWTPSMRDRVLNACVVQCIGSIPHDVIQHRGRPRRRTVPQYAQKLKI
jgi:hypothetical protein